MTSPLQTTAPPNTRWRPRLRPSVASVALAGFAVLAASCGSAAATSSETTVAAESQLGESGIPSIDTTPPTTVASAADANALDEDSSEEEVFEAWTACMEENGVDPEIFLTNPDDAEAAVIESDPVFVAAQQACDAMLEAAFGSFELDPAMEAELGDRSVRMAECGREVLGIEIPDDILLLEADDPRMLELDALETTPEQDAALEECFTEILGDLLGEDGELIIDDEGGAE